MSVAYLLPQMVGADDDEAKSDISKYERAPSRVGDCTALATGIALACYLTVRPGWGESMSALRTLSPLASPLHPHPTPTCT